MDALLILPGRFERPSASRVLQSPPNSGCLTCRPPCSRRPRDEKQPKHPSSAGAAHLTAWGVSPRSTIENARQSPKGRRNPSMVAAHAEGRKPGSPTKRARAGLFAWHGSPGGSLKGEFYAGAEADAVREEVRHWALAVRPSRMNVLWVTRKRAVRVPFVSPLSGLHTVVGLGTQGFASLHPGLELGRRFAAGGRAVVQGCE